MKNVICTLVAIILIISLFDLHNSEYITISYASSNNYITFLNDDDEQNDSQSNNSSEEPSDPALKIIEADEKEIGSENSESNDVTNISDNIIIESEASESVNPSDTNIYQENTESNESTPNGAYPNENSDCSNVDQTNSIVPTQENFYLIDTLNKENMWSNKTVYLTFDDGPSQITEQVLDVLNEEKISATFFVIGNKTEKGKILLKRIDEEGHSIGNHTYSHNYNYIYKSSDNFFNDLYKNEKMIYEATGKYTKIIRFPGGSNNSASKTESGKKVMNEIMNRLIDEGYIYFDWNASSGDASLQPATVDGIVNNVLTWVGKHNNAVVLFHDNYTKVNTLKALPIIVKKLKFLGCKFDTLDKNSYHVSFTNKYYSILKMNHRKPLYIVKKLKKLEARYNEQ